ncbi:unnamed protein product, partial [Rhizoctonia solani]
MVNKTVGSRGVPPVRPLSSSTMPYVPAKRRSQAANLAEARAKKKLMRNQHSNDENTEGTERESHVTPSVTSEPPSQLNVSHLLTPQANSRPRYQVRIKFDPRSHKPLEPAPHRCYHTRMGTPMVEYSPESPIPTTEPPETPQELCNNTTTGIDADLPGNVDLKYDPKHLLLLRSDAENALLKITRILNVPRDKGQGYKECKLDK